MTQIILPWPAKELSPNSRRHWAIKAKAAKKYKADCFKIATSAKYAKDYLGRTTVIVFREGLKSIRLKITFHPPDKCKRDDDNIIGSFKAGRDGIASAWGVDDNIFKCTYVIGEPRRGGAVIVEVV